jgi:hypothetical protein
MQGLASAYIIINFIFSAFVVLVSTLVIFGVDFFHCGFLGLVELNSVANLLAPFDDISTLEAANRIEVKSVGRKWK